MRHRGVALASERFLTARTASEAPRQMAKSLKEWVETDVAHVKERPLKWISGEHFFRDPSRPMFSHDEYFFSPADGIIIYQREVHSADCIVDIKGKAYSLRSAMQDDAFDQPCLVIGIFMT